MTTTDQMCLAGHVVSSGATWCCNLPKGHDGPHDDGLGDQWSDAEPEEPVATDEVDVDTLPPTQYLILEVLAARYRTGETHWTFPDKVAPAARALEQAGLVWLRSGPVAHCFEVRFTDAGRAAALSGEWRGIRVTAVVNWRRERVHGITADPEVAMQWVREINDRHGDPLAATQCADVVRPGEGR